MKIIKFVVLFLVILIAVNFCLHNVLSTFIIERLNKFDNNPTPTNTEPIHNDSHFIQPSHEGLKKPAIYLYPISTQKIKVSLDINGSITKTIPNYSNGWEVTVTPQGLINNQFDYLFYEANLNKLDLPNESWIVKKTDLDQWFTKNLPLLGLNQKETNQFKEYWLKVLDKNNYYQIKLLDNKFLNQNVKLNIDPKPDTIIRLIFDFKPLKNQTQTTETKIITPQRKGFTMVEWGGILEK
jgi:hypothetical protein